MKDGGPAFPQTIDDMGTMRSVTAGMSLRDYFAGQIIGHLNPYDPALHRSNAEVAYMQADAMLAEREKGAAV